MLPRKIAVKRLTASDLTFFEWHFRNHPAGNQKAINLNADVFIDQLYPGLPPIAIQQLNGRIPIDMHLFGPGIAGDYNLQRKIIKAASYKNWRLDGEFIFNPPDIPDRFNSLRADDIAVLEFFGEPVPMSIQAFLLSQALADDLRLAQEFSALLGDRSMASVSVSQIERVLTAAAPTKVHPILVLGLETAIEDAAQNGIAGVDELLKRPSSHRITREALTQARKNAIIAGDLGEEYVNAHLDRLRTQGSIRSYEWVSMSNAISPFDFRTLDGAGAARLLDVKATQGAFGSRIHVSLNELRAIATVTEVYDIYRVYEMSDQQAKLRIAADMKAFAVRVLESMKGLPPGTSVDSISISPEVLSFGVESELMLADS